MRIFMKFFLSAFLHLTKIEYKRVENSIDKNAENQVKCHINQKFRQASINRFTHFSAVPKITIVPTLRCHFAILPPSGRLFDEYLSFLPVVF